MRFEFFVSRRYLASRERRGLISLITVISIGGVAVGVAALITVIGVMDGFDKELVERIMGSSSHLTIRRSWLDTLTDYNRLAAAAELDPDVLGASPLISRQAIIQPRREIEATPVGVIVNGFDFARERKITNFIDDVFPGHKAEPGKREIVLGAVLAQRLGIYRGDTVYVLTSLAKFAVGARAKINPMTVVGIFQTGLYDVDANLTYTSLAEAQRIFLLGDEADQIHLRLKDPFSLGPAKKRLSQRLRLPEKYIVGWDELNRQFFNALKLEKIAMFIILLLIVLVAAFNIIGTLVMIVIEKTRDIGILRSMGTSQRQILLIFLLQGLIVGFLGILFGLAIGFFICWSLNSWVPIPLPAGIYGIDRLPVLIRGDTVAIIVVSALVICLVASLLPAWRASRLQPTDALRYE